AVDKNLEPADLPLPELPNALFAAGLTACLELADVLGELPDHRQMLRQKCQTSIRWFANIRGCGRVAVAVKHIGFLFNPVVAQICFLDRYRLPPKLSNSISNQ